MSPDHSSLCRCRSRSNTAVVQVSRSFSPENLKISFHCLLRLKISAIFSSTRLSFSTPVTSSSLWSDGSTCLFSSFLVSIVPDNFSTSFRFRVRDFIKGAKKSRRAQIVQKTAIFLANVHVPPGICSALFTTDSIERPFISYVCRHFMGVISI